MDVTPLVSDECQVIEAYGNGGFRVNGKFHLGSVIIHADRCLSWHVDEIDNFTLNSLSFILESSDIPEILLVGCGTGSVYFPGQLRTEIRARGIVVDSMNTGAACRTYNVLMTEGRRVAAALIAVD